MLVALATGAAAPPVVARTAEAVGPACTERGAGQGAARVVPLADHDPATAAAMLRIRDAVRASAAVRVHRDPVTGELRAPADEATALPGGGVEQVLFRTLQEQEPELLGSGMYKMRLDGAFVAPLVATRDADGRVRVQHGEER
jgi:hypothetical protein